MHLTILLFHSSVLYSKLIKSKPILWFSGTRNALGVRIINDVMYNANAHNNIHEFKKTCQWFYPRCLLKRLFRSIYMYFFRALFWHNSEKKNEGVTGVAEPWTADPFRPAHI